MKSSLIPFCLLAALLGAGCAEFPVTFPWPDFQERLEPHESASSVKAELPSGIKIIPPGPEVSADKAGYTGVWGGWAYEGYAYDVKTAFEENGKDGVTLAFAIANPAIGKHGEPLHAHFRMGTLGEELYAELSNGAVVHYHLRADGNMDFMRERGNLWMSGVLTRIK